MAAFCGPCDLEFDSVPALLAHVAEHGSEPTHQIYPEADQKAAWGGES